MTTATPIRAALETAKTSDHTGVGAAYATLGSSLSASAHSLIISSSLDKSCWISTDLTNNKILIISGTSLSIDVSGNKQGSGQLAFPKGTQFYVKQGPDGASSTGDISLTAIYAR